MSSLDRHEAGKLLDYALRLRLAGHSIKDVEARKSFIRRAKTLEKRALLLLGADTGFQASLPPEIRPS
jgi:hypothetical protein